MVLDEINYPSFRKEDVADDDAGLIDNGMEKLTLKESTTQNNKEKREVETKNGHWVRLKPEMGTGPCLAWPDLGPSGHSPNGPCLAWPIHPGP